MIRTFSLSVIGLTAAAAAGIALAAPLPAVNGGEIHTAPIATRTAATDASDRVYCYNGVTGDQTNRYRGWVCEPEHRAETR
jgi:hypothetical protein